MPILAHDVNINGIVVLTNDVARRLWELLAQECSLDELVAAVTERFDVDFAQAHVDVQTFLDEIALMGMLQQ